MEITGKIKFIDETKTYGNNGFQKRELIITTNDDYPQPISIEFVQDKCTLLDNYSVGQDVKVGINLKGREWKSPEGETKYFNSIQGWRIEKEEFVEKDIIPPPDDTPGFAEKSDEDNEVEDDLPF